MKKINLILLTLLTLFIFVSCKNKKIDGLKFEADANCVSVIICPGK